MSVTAPGRRITVDDWVEQQPEKLFGRVEIVDGLYVIKKTGGNPHNFIAGQLAQTLMAQMNVYAIAPGQLILEGTPDNIRKGRIPDVLVNGPEAIQDGAYAGVPILVAEIWSPTNTLKEMTDKRREYLAHGVAIMVEGYIQGSDVHLEWHVNADWRWELRGVADGEELLEVSFWDRVIKIRPNDLLRLQTRPRE